MAITHKLPPHSKEAEQQLLGACLIDGGTLNMCLNVGVKVDSFYLAANRVIYNRLVIMMADGKPIDLMVLAQELTQHKEMDGIGNYAYLMEVSKATPTTIQARYFAEQLKQLAMRRNIIRYASDLAERCYEIEGENVREVIADPVAKLLNVAMGNEDKQEQDWNETIDEALAYIDSVEENKGPPPDRVLDFPFEEMNQLFGKPERGQLIVLGGRPSAGKSSLVRQIASKAAHDKHFIYFVTLEVQPVRVVLNMAQAATRIGLKVLPEAHKLDREDFRNVIRGLRKLGIFMSKSDDTLGKIAARARALHAQHKMGVMIVDHGRLLKDLQDAPRDEQEAICGRISSTFKRLAVELDCWMFLLWQLKGEGDEEPRLSDLKGSRDVEANADKVLFVFRPKVNLTGESQASTVHVSKLPVYFQQVTQQKGRDDGVATWDGEFVRQIAAWRQIVKTKSKSSQDEIEI